ncbi:MAG: 3-phosphoglycerate dehydrogenase family protein [Tenericutes bacterium]|nr:3-phosphoglycerate dehydrogenase family protein [Mycoplasmatota bacterium]
MKNIHCLNKISQVGLSQLPESYQLVDQINNADAILVRSANMHEMKLPESVVAVARAGAGVNNIPLSDYAKKGVVVFNTPGANSNAVVELILAGMLLSARNIYQGMRWIEDNKKDEQVSKSIEKAKSQFAGTEILNKTIGIIGLGAIGASLSEVCSSLGMFVYGTTTLNYEEYEKKTLPKNMTLMRNMEEFLDKCDYISLNIPLTPETKHIINQDVINKMKDGVVILNFARDGLVNDDDIEQALQSKKVKQYVTDFPNYRTANMEGVLAIPHLGASTEEAEDNCAYMASKQIVDYIENGNITNSVNFPFINQGNKPSDHRLSILYDASIDLCKQINDIIGKENVQNCSLKSHQEFGAAIIDIKTKITNDQLNQINQIKGVLKARLI